MMNCNGDALCEFLSAATRDRFKLLENPATSTAVRDYLGEPAFEELQKLQKRSRAHLAIDVPPNVIFLPGIMGSLLTSRTKGGVWWIDVRSRNHLKDLKLSDDGKADSDPSNDVAVVTFPVPSQGSMTKRTQG